MMNKLLRAEGLALLIGATYFYWQSGGSWLLFALLFFVPDLSFTAYLAGRKWGAFGYNLLHTLISPIIFCALAIVISPLAVVTSVALIWLAHIGFDRALGYGLKYTSSFNDTHLGRIGN
jgi:hypothetical protein